MDVRFWPKADMRLCAAHPDTAHRLMDGLMLTVYHCTNEGTARQILADGFRNTTARYLTDREWSGVWVSDRPLNNSEGASGEIVLQVEIAEEVLKPYEWIEEGKSYREWLVPARILNQDGEVKRAAESTAK